MTIGRDRWQQHLKSSGRHYHERAEALEQLHRDHPTVGADIAAMAHHALAEVMEACRAGRLTRNQHVLLRLGEWVAVSECAGALARRAARAIAGELPAKGDRRFEPAALATISRVFAREAALKVTTEGVRWVHGGSPDVDAGLGERAGLASVLAAQHGLIDDMNAVAAALYGRES
jgi:alkylation response protein AidB-like acyl-CoA dehydrogenase